jgi:hypothetical protein
MDLDPPPLEEIAIMTESFSITNVSIPFLVDLFKQGIQTLDTNTNLAVIRCWGTQSNNIGFSTEIKEELLKEIVDNILPDSFGALFSMLHSSCYDELCRFISDQIRLLISNTNTYDKIIEKLNESLQAIVPEPVEGLYNSFFQYCFAETTPRYKILGSINTLLSSLRKVSPVDSDAFEIAKPRQSRFTCFTPFGISSMIDSDSFIFYDDFLGSTTFLITKKESKKP